MVRRYVCLGFFLLSSVASGDLLEIDVSGRDGDDGRDGANRSGSAGTGGRGQDGGDAGKPTRGEDAGSIDVKFNVPSAKGKPAVLMIQGEIKTPAGSAKGVNTEIVVGNQGYIYFKARGGKGGDGGDGGDGQDGGKGSSGSDATRYSSGGNGGPGGDGGDGGAATSGEDGGHGGKITVRLNAEDTDMLMLVQDQETFVVGGQEGRKGTHGNPGSGGAGGDGGSSYSWTTSEPYTDSQGNRQTRTEHHSNPGGWDGPAGSSGSRSSRSLSDGQDGQDGRYEIAVEDGGKTTTYSSRYRLELDGFKFQELNKDGVMEPAETVHLKEITVRNTGGMPMPAHQKVKIYLENREWVISDGQILNIPEVLGPGESYTLKGAELKDIKFTIRDTTISEPGERFSTTDKIRPLADLERVERRFLHFDNPQQFTITFPIEITPVTSLESLVPGERSRIFWEVRNISGKDFGGASELKRVIATSLSTGEGKAEGEGLSAKDISLKTKDGSDFDLRGTAFLEQIAHLKAGDSVMVEGSVAFNQGVESYRAVRLNTDLKLGTIADPSQSLVRHMRTKLLRVGQAYQKTKDSDFLIMTNNRTTHEEITAWKNLMTKLGLKADIWDLSIEGHVDLARALANNQRLVDDFRGKTLVFLDNSFDAASGTLNASDFIRKDQFLKAAGEFGINVYVPGEVFDMSEYLIPTGELTRDHTHKSVKGFVDELRGRVAKNNSLALNKGDGSLWDVTLEADTIDGDSWLGLWSKPTAKSLEKQALKLQKKLQRLYPERRYVVIHNFDSKLIKKYPWLFTKRYSSGTLQVRRTVDSLEGSAVSLHVKDSELHAPKFIASDDNIFGLMLSMGFDDKIKLLNDFVTSGQVLDAHGEEMARLLGRAILFDIADEQVIVRKSQDLPAWKKALSFFWTDKKRLIDRMPKLKALSEGRVNAVLTHLAGKELPNARVLAELAAGIEALTESQTYWWHHIFGDALEVTKVAKSLNEGYIESIFGREAKAFVPLQPDRIESSHLTVANEESGRKMIAEEKLKLLAQFAEFRKGRKGWKSDHGLVFFRQAHTGSDYESDLAHLGDPKMRTISQDKFDKVAKADAARQRNIASFVDANAKKRCDFLMSGFPASAPGALASAHGPMASSTPPPSEVVPKAKTRRRAKE